MRVSGFNTLAADANRDRQLPIVYAPVIARVKQDTRGVIKLSEISIKPLD